MARTRATLLASIWADPEWVALTPAAQRTYLLVLSQPKLSLVGVIDFLPGRWATMAAGTTAADIRAAVTELADARFVLLDEDTDELAIRSFVRYDLPPTPNINQMKGLWSAWGAIASPVLRAAVLAEMPDQVWTHDKIPPPPDAIAGSCNIVGSDATPDVAPSEPADDTARPDGPSERADATSLFPSPSSRFPLPTARPHDDDPAPNPLSPHAERLQRAQAAIEILTDRTLAASTTRTSRSAHRHGIHNGKTRDHLTRLVALAHEHPTWTANQLADHIEPPPTARRQGPALPPPWQPADVPDAVPMAAGVTHLRAVRGALA